MTINPDGWHAASYVRVQLLDGVHPDAIVQDVEAALQWLATDWAQWGDGRWRSDMVCSVCGSELAGVCGHRESAGPPILRREYEAAKAAGGTA